MLSGPQTTDPTLSVMTCGPQISDPSLSVVSSGPQITDPTLREFIKRSSNYRSIFKRNLTSGPQITDPPFSVIYQAVLKLPIHLQA